MDILQLSIEAVDQSELSIEAVDQSALSIETADQSALSICGVCGARACPGPRGSGVCGGGGGGGGGASYRGGCNN